MRGERIEQRVLGALRLMDRATWAPLTRPMKISSEAVRLVRNRQGLYVVTHAQGLEALTQSFMTQPAAPAPGANTYTLDVQDPQKRYLPRRLSLRLPRDPDPSSHDSADSLFRPHDVAMYPAGTAPLSPNWSTVRVSVSAGRDPQNTRPAQGSLIRIVNAADDKVLASGISDERGEALVIVPGVPVTRFADEADAGGGPPGGGPPGGGGPGGGHGPGNDHDREEPPVVVNTLAVRLEVSLADSTPWPVNPDLLEANHAANRRQSMELELATGRMERVAVNITLT